MRKTAENPASSASAISSSVTPRSRKHVDLQEADDVRAQRRRRRPASRSRRSRGRRRNRPPPRRGPCPPRRRGAPSADRRPARRRAVQATSCPSTVVAVETGSIPQSTRWRSRWRRERRDGSRASVRSSPAPPAKYSPQCGIDARRGQRLDVRSASVGSRARRAEPNPDAGERSRTGTERGSRRRRRTRRRTRGS